MAQSKVHLIVRFAPAAALAIAVMAGLPGCEEGAGADAAGTSAGQARTQSQSTPDDDGEYQPQSTLGKAKGLAEDTVEMAEDYNDELMKEMEGTRGADEEEDDGQ